MKAFGVLIAIPLKNKNGKKATEPFNEIYSVFLSNRVISIGIYWKDAHAEYA